MAVAAGSQRTIKAGDKVTILDNTRDDHFQDECGVFGVFGHPETANLAYLGLYALQHRGQESAGMVSSDGNELYVHRAMGEVEEIFQPSVIAQLPRSRAIGHTRYSTAVD